MAHSLIFAEKESRDTKKRPQKFARTTQLELWEKLYWCLDYCLG